MTDPQLTKKEVEALETQIKADQEKPIRENERRVRIVYSHRNTRKAMK